MSIIPCMKNCDYQKEGYCMLEKAAEITDEDNECPHLIKPSTNKIDGFRDVFDGK